MKQWVGKGCGQRPFISTGRDGGGRTAGLRLGNFNNFGGLWGMGALSSCLGSGFGVVRLKG